MTENLKELSNDSLVDMVLHCNWCGLPDCKACKHNQEYVDELKRRLRRPVVSDDVCSRCGKDIDYKIHPTCQIERNNIKKYYCRECFDYLEGEEQAVCSECKVFIGKVKDMKEFEGTLVCPRCFEKVIK